ncbi:hypothetical protein RCC89_04395 [Cytophagaceae bacterium ABcell3]|nr:hypothetical protein RCC89_04395 [Cytophagaceae bacterium ABcell3]
MPDPYITLLNKGLVYNATFNYKESQVSGLLVLKRTGVSSYHVVMLSKPGPTLMEFTLDQDGLTWIKTFERLEEKKLTKLIENDFRMLLLDVLENPSKVKKVKTENDKTIFKMADGTRLKVDNTANRVLTAQNKSFLNFISTKATFSYRENEIPQTIFLAHNIMNLSLELELLPK